MVVGDPDVLIACQRDQSRLTAFGESLALIRARTVADVVATLKTAHRYGIPVVMRGAGTRPAGGANALDGCIVLSTEKLNRIQDIDERSRTASSKQV